VSSLNYAHDVKVDREFFRLAGEEYRKVRNTLRFLLSNLADFDPERDRRELGPLDRHSLDAWVMSRLSELVHAVRGAYETYQFRSAHQTIFNFCNDTLSAVYLAAVKDRLYCDAVADPRRRRCQTALWDLAAALIRLVAPILPHTADEAWLALRGSALDDPSCVHEQWLPEPLRVDADPAWAEAMSRRDAVLKALEERRSAGGLDNPLDAGIELHLPQDVRDRLLPFAPELADLCGVSRLSLIASSDEHVEVTDLSAEPRCERSWKRDPTVRQRSDGGWLSDRDAAALNLG